MIDWNYFISGYLKYSFEKTSTTDNVQNNMNFSPCKSRISNQVSNSHFYLIYVSTQFLFFRKMGTFQR